MKMIWYGYVFLFVERTVPKVTMLEYKYVL
jgi:hypothetical protein